MDLEDAFTQDAIEAAGVAYGQDWPELRLMINRVCMANEIEMTTEQQNVAMLCFDAGRAYQTDQDTAVTVEMSISELREYSLFLLSRGRDE